MFVNKFTLKVFNIIQMKYTYMFINRMRTLILKKPTLQIIKRAFKKTHEIPVERDRDRDRERHRQRHRQRQTDRPEEK